MIAFANQKGGVAKTTTALNLAVAFKESGHDVLAVDMDPQGNLTMSQGIDPDKVEKSMFDVLVHRIPLREVIVEREIDVAVASIDLAGAEIAMSAQIGRERSLQKAIDEVRGDYDFICIDTPPSLGLLTVNALTAADKVIVPVQCEYLSMRGLVQLQNTLQMIRENLNPDVEIEGILPTMLDSRTVHAKEAVEILEENFGDLVFQSRIKKAIKFAEAPVRGASVLKYDPQGNAAKYYRALAEGGPDARWLRSAPACARAPSPTCSAPPTSRCARTRSRVTATADAGSGVEVALAAEEITVERSRGPAWRRHPSRSRPPRGAARRDRARTRRTAPRRAARTGEAMVEPHKDPAVEEIERRQTPRATRSPSRGGQGRARGPRAPDGRQRARMSAPRSAATSPTPPPTPPSCRAPTRPCCAWSASAAPASTRSTAWSRHSCRASSSSPSTPTFSRCRARTPTSPCTSAPSSPEVWARARTPASATAPPSRSRTRSSSC